MPPSRREPRNWSECGQIYIDGNGHCVFVCRYCLRRKQCFELSFKTFDSTSFWTHIKNVHKRKATEQQIGVDESPAKTAKTQNLKIVVSDDTNNNNTLPVGDISKTHSQPNCDAGDDADKCSEKGVEVDAFEAKVTPTAIIELTDDDSMDSEDCILVANKASTNQKTKNSGFVSNCPTCKEAFTTTEKFYAHLRSQHHYVSKMCPFQCKACGRRTASVRAMTDHQDRFHSNESTTGTATCRICHKVVSQYHLRNHLLGHSTTPRNFKCKICLRLYRHKRYFAAHMQNVHPWAAKNP